MNYKSQLQLLKSRRFFPLFISQLLGSFNDNVFKNALVIMIGYRVMHHTESNFHRLAALAVGIFILPFFLFSAYAGQVADKYEKAVVIRGIKLVEAIIMILAAAALAAHNITLMAIALFLLGVKAAFMGPVKYAILPEHLMEDELIGGNGLMQAGICAALLFGAVFSGILIVKPGYEQLFAGILCLAAACGFFASMYIPKSGMHNQGLAVHYNFVQETIRLILYSRDRWDIYLSILGISWFWVVGTVFFAELPSYTHKILYADEMVGALFVAAFSIGIGLGALYCNRLLKGRVQATFVPLALLGMTIFSIDLYFAGIFSHLGAPHQLAQPTQLLATFNGWRMLLDLVAIGACGGLYTVPLYAILQQRCNPAHRARVIASSNVINALVVIISSLVTVLLLKLGLTVGQLFLAVAIFNGVVALYICRLLPEVLLKSLLQSVLKFVYQVDVIGLENYEKAGNRFIIIANHTSYIDAALLAAFLPDRLAYVVDPLTIKKKWIKLFLPLVDTFQMDPADPMALKSFIDFIKQDKRCVFFPEGRLTMTGTLMKIYEAPGLAADKAEAKLLPVHIQGAQYSHFSRLRGKVRIRWMPKVTLTIFPVQELGIPGEIKGRQRRQQIGLKLYDLMRDMIFSSSGYHQTLFNALLDAKAMHGSRHKCVEDTDRVPVSYQQFILRSFILGGLIAKQTESGENVGVLLPNLTSTVVVFFAMQAYHRVPAMINFSSGIKNVLLACEVGRIKTVYTAEKFIKVAQLEELVAAMQNAGVNVIYLESLRSQVGTWAKLKGLLFSLAPRFAYRKINKLAKKQKDFDANLPAVVLFTSGSEGSPKGVVLSHKNIQANRFQIGACVDFTSTDKILNVLPMFHSFGLTAGVLLPMLSGVQVFLYPSPLHYRIVPELSYDINATILFSTDTFLTGYAKYAHHYDFYSVRYIFSGAEKLREETINIWAKKFGVRIFEGYGVTETSPVLAVNTPMHNQLGTVGRFMPGIQYRLRPVEGISEGGVLEVCGPNIMSGYLLANAPGVIQPPKDGWHDTGDIVSVDEEGYITIKGRVKRFAKIGGEMVSLPMVEQQINLLWPDFQHAVISLPHPRKGEQVVLVTTNLKATREEVVAHALKQQMPEISIPKKILAIKEMLLLGSGKVSHVAVTEWAQQQLASDVDEPEEETAVA